MDVDEARQVLGLSDDGASVQEIVDAQMRCLDLALMNNDATFMRRSVEAVAVLFVASGHMSQATADQYVASMEPTIASTSASIDQAEATLRDVAEGEEQARREALVLEAQKQALAAEIADTQAAVAAAQADYDTAKRAVAAEAEARRARRASFMRKLFFWKR